MWEPPRMLEEGGVGADAPSVPLGGCGVPVIFSPTNEARA